MVLEALIEQDSVQKPVETDVIIIGAGPVGLFTIFQIGMLGLRCHVLDTLEVLGGQCSALYPEKPIYDIPGFPRIDALALIHNLEAQAAPFAPIYHLGHSVQNLTQIEEGTRVEIKTEAGLVIQAQAVIIAAGVGAFGPNRPPLADLALYEGKSVHYLIRRREDFRDQRLVIAGGGDSAVDWALSLHDVARHISVVHRRQKFRAARESETKLRDLAAHSDRLDLVIPYHLAALEGKEGYLTDVHVQTIAGVAHRIPADHLLAFFGLAVALGPITEWGLAMEQNLISVNPVNCATSVTRIFAIGDIATYPGKLKLILSGFNEAALAAHAIQALVYPDQEFHFEYSTTKGVPVISPKAFRL